MAKPVPIHGLFHTPKNMEEVLRWIEKLPPSERVAATVAAMMTWNFLATETNKAFGLKESEDAHTESNDLGRTEHPHNRGDPDP